MNEPDFRITNHVGTIFYTTPDEDRAKAEARRLARTFPHLKVVKVEIVKTEQVVYRPRLNLVRAA